jgi:hypothetical protein
MSEHERWRYVYENDRFFFKSSLGNTMTPRLAAEAINALKAENERLREAGVDALYIQCRQEVASLKAENEAFQSIIDEMKRQDEKWGVNRTHPNEWYPILGKEFGELGKAMLENHFDYPDANPDEIRKELIEVMAVGIQWLKSLALLERE